LASEPRKRKRTEGKKGKGPKEQKVYKEGSPQVAAGKGGKSHKRKGDSLTPLQSKKGQLNRRGRLKVGVRRVPGKITKTADCQPTSQEKQGA